MGFILICFTLSAQHESEKGEIKSTKEARSIDHEKSMNAVKMEDRDQLQVTGKIESESRSPFVQSDELKAERSEQEKFIESQSVKINSLKSTNTIWRLKSIAIDEARLVENKAQKDELVSNASEDFAKDLIYVESETEVLIAPKDASNGTFIYGEKKILGSNALRVNHLSGCATCSKEYSFVREVGNGELKVIMQDQDEDKKDVFYVLTFKN